MLDCKMNRSFPLIKLLKRMFSLLAKKAHLKQRRTSNEKDKNKTFIYLIRVLRMSRSVLLQILIMLAMNFLFFIFYTS